MDKLMPIGIQDFKKLRTDEKGYLYIDKTEEIYRLLTTSSVVFLSRPRRFGKSLLLSTIRYLFEGERELFEGLWICDKWDWGTRYPVMLLSMPSASSVDDLRKKLVELLLECRESFELDVKEEKETV